MIHFKKFKKKKEENKSINEIVVDLELHMMNYKIPDLSSLEKIVNIEIKKFLNTSSKTHDKFSSPDWLKSWIHELIEIKLQDLQLQKINNMTIIQDRCIRNTLQSEHIDKRLKEVTEQIKELEIKIKNENGGISI